MTPDSPLSGIHEELITRELAARLEAARREGAVAESSVVEDNEAPEVLARHLEHVLRSALARVPAKERLAQQARIANRVLAVLRDELEKHGPAPDQDLPESLEQLLEVRTPAGNLGSKELTARPSTPFGATDVLMNLRGEPAIGRELKLELASATSVDLICSFLKWSGYCLLREELRALVQGRGGKLRVLTTTYVGVTERRVLDDLATLGAEVKVSYEHQRTRLHAKAWLFHRAHGLTTSYVGSSNVSRSALVDGLEWNVRLSTPSAPDAIARIRDTFDALWLSPEFESYDPKREGDQERFDKARKAASGQGDRSSFIPMLELRPHPFQEEMLDRLTFARASQDRHRNLIVAATGTGKTVMAALDFMRLHKQLKGASLLFVAHREQILQQARGTFATAMRDGDFGEMMARGVKPIEGTHVFATIQSLSAATIQALSPETYDVVIIDEFHHASAPTYQRLIDHLRPKELLGLTATPERADGHNVQDEFFEGHITAELRLWDALEHELLVPFHYFGIADGTDLSRLNWRQGSYDVRQLGDLYTGDDARLNAVMGAVDDYICDRDDMKALGFCVGVEHARWMAARFNQRDVPAAFLHGGSPHEERQRTIKALKTGELKVIFTADLFNEGVDIPEVNTVLLLRPTDSPVLFQQQLGRGLRRSDGKDCLTVLDFIGAQHKKFRMDRRLGQLCGAKTRTGVTKAVQGLFPHLPPGCSLQLERTAQDVVLGNLRESLGSSITTLVASLRHLGPEANLQEFLEESRVDLEDLFRSKARTWSALRRRAGFEVADEGPIDERLRSALCRLTHLDDEQYLSWLERFLRDPLPTTPPEDPRERLYLEMLAAGLFGYAHGKAGYESETESGSLTRVLVGLSEHPSIVADYRELVTVRIGELSKLTLPFRERPSIPLRVHATYSLAEALAGLGHVSASEPKRVESGVFQIKEQDLDAFFFTVQKTEKQYSPTTLYRDFALSQDLIHWESQSRTAADSKTSKRYIHHRAQNHEILLFAREARKGSNGQTMPYTFLGPADYVSHKSSRPVAFKWRLRHPMLPATYEFTKLARA